MSRQIKAVGVVILACYLALFVKLNQLQVVQADDYNSRPENTRQQVRDFNNPRGDISTTDGVLVATSEERAAELQFQRIYPHGELYAHITGYYSFTLGSTGVERTYNDELAGRTASLRLHSIKGLFDDSPAVGDVVLTIDSRLQETARRALDGQEGAVVAIEPTSGAVLAMYSNPSYDPNGISDNDQASATKKKSWLDAMDTKPLLSRTFQERYFPGSTFKVVTAAAGLESGMVTVDQPEYPVTTSYTPPGTTRAISNFDGTLCGGTLMQILARSCNSSFAEMAAQTLGPEPMINTSEAAGFNSPVPLDLPRPAESRYPTDFGKIITRPEGSAPVHENSAALAQTGIGQNDVAATPLQMALVAAGIANDGRIMTPHVMSEIRAHDGTTVDSYEPKVWKRFMGESSARTLREAMLGVVDDGTASSIQLPGMEVGGKTGTAQLGVDPPRSHAWMIAFAGPPGEPARIAVAVMVQDVPGNSGATGGRIAGPIARAVLTTALDLQ